MTPPSDRWGPLPPHAFAPNHPRHHGWRRLERMLFVVALIALGYYASVQIQTFLYQRAEMRELDAVLSSRRSASAPMSATTSAPTSRPYPPGGSTIGRIEIPRLNVSAIVRAGSDAKTLSLAVGHIPGTVLPGEAGNAGMAAHRDTFFKRLGGVRAGDDITVTTPDGVFRYIVERTVVVEPTDVWVLDPTPHAALTLVTCYPFSYLGAAPQRFIVRASLAG